VTENWYEQVMIKDEVQSKKDEHARNQRVENVHSYSGMFVCGESSIGACAAMCAKPSRSVFRVCLGFLLAGLLARTRACCHCWSLVR